MLILALIIAILGFSLLAINTYFAGLGSREDRRWHYRSARHKFDRFPPSVDDQDESS